MSCAPRLQAGEGERRGDGDGTGNGGTAGAPPRKDGVPPSREGGTGSVTAVFTLEGVAFRYSETELLTDVSLTISEGEKAGFVGRNGAGKSTLLKLLTGEEAPGRGTVARRNGITLSFLPQNPVILEDVPLVEQVLASFGNMDGARMEAAAYEAKSILTRLGVDDFTLPPRALSGGQRKRVALAGALLRPCDALLLDEPTNHIDSGMVDWLEDYLRAYKGTLLLVTHDRYLLDRVCGRILEVGSGRVISYAANYTGFLEQKAAREDLEAATARKQRSLYKKELAWIQRGARARSTKAKGRVDRFEELKESLSAPAGKDALDLSGLTSRLGKKILAADRVSKSLGGQALIRDFSLSLSRDDRIGIIGPNGCGKTTLLRVLAGELPPDRGAVDTGETVRIGFFRQLYPETDPNTRVIDAVRGVAEVVRTPEGVLTAGQMLERFLFPAGQQYQQVFRLSGGEKRRLQLLQVLMRAPNVLFLDEPTNDLDIETLAVLEDYLDSFSGAVVAVSHDRYFLDRVTRRLLAFEEGTLVPYQGGYDAYLGALREKDAPLPAEKPVREQAPPPPPRPQPVRKRFSYREQKEFDGIEECIAGLEKRVASLDDALVEHAADYLPLMEITREKEQAEAELEQALRRWLQLTEIKEEIDRNAGAQAPPAGGGPAQPDG